MIDERGMLDLAQLLRMVVGRWSLALISMISSYSMTTSNFEVAASQVSEPFGCTKETG
jgi:hypothetical protein